MKYILTISIFIFIVCNGCKLTDEKIKNNWWKYGSGYHIADVLNFGNNNLRNDTVFINNNPSAVIIKKEYGLFGNDNEITIKSLETSETGIYHEK